MLVTVSLVFPHVEAMVSLFPSEQSGPWNGSCQPLFEGGNLEQARITLDREETAG
jgi:hypothetical protein